MNRVSFWVGVDKKLVDPRRCVRRHEYRDPEQSVAGWR
jgi:hypothetical protein